MSMKRALAIFILMLYSIANFGISVHTHWCGGKISSVRISYSLKHTCGCGPKMDIGCCKNGFVYSKLSNEHVKSANNVIQDYKNDLKPIVSLKPIDFSISFIVTRDISNYHAPPFKTKLPVFLSNSVFRI